MNRSILGRLSAFTLFFLAGGCDFLFTYQPPAGLSLKEQVGKLIFFDKRLSDPPGQSCAACHGPGVGFTGPDLSVNIGGAVYPGAVHSRFGNRKPPTVAYAGDSPVLHYDEARKTWVGGMFWDGRATGAQLRDPLAEQAMGPPLNPLEQNLADKRAMVRLVAGASYAPLFRKVWGIQSLDPVNDVDGSYERIARSMAAYERSREVNPFSSKYDLSLKGNTTLSERERTGMQLFMGKGRCANCHTPPLFTDFTYDNTGVPKNPKNPFYAALPRYNPEGANWIDYGLGAHLKDTGYAQEVYAREMGKHKVPTLRNVDKRPDESFIKAYLHNGSLKSLKDVVHFYNTRDVDNWPPPEVTENMNREDIGNLGLTGEEEDAIVAFMRTLSDGYRR